MLNEVNGCVNSQYECKQLINTCLSSFNYSFDQSQQTHHLMDEIAFGFDDLDDDSCYDMLKWLNSTESVKYERVSRRFKWICESHQRRQKVLVIQLEYESEFDQDNDYLCDDINHTPTDPIIIEDVNLVPKIASKFINLKALYLLGHDDCFPSWESYFIPQHLQHLHFDVKDDLQSLHHILSFIFDLDIKHFVFPNQYSQAGFEVMKMMLLKMPNLQMIYIDQMDTLTLKFWPNLVDYRCEFIRIGELKKLCEIKGAQLHRFSTGAVLEGVYPYAQLMTKTNLDMIFNEMSSLKHLAVPGFFELTESMSIFHKVWLEFKSCRDAVRGKFKVDKLRFYTINSNISKFILSQDHSINYVILPHLNYLIAKDVVDFLLKFRDLNFVKFLNVDPDSSLITELINRELNLKLIILEINRGSEINNPIILLAEKNPKTLIVCRFQDGHRAEGYSSHLENVILKYD